MAQKHCATEGTQQMDKLPFPRVLWISTHRCWETCDGQEVSYS